MTPSSTACPPTMISLFWLISITLSKMQKPQPSNKAVEPLSLAHCGFRLYQLSMKIHGSGAGFFLLRVFLLESFDATRGIDQLLFAGEKRMAIRANFNVDLFFGRTRRARGAAGAHDLTFDVFGMNAFFHF